MSVFNKKQNSRRGRSRDTGENGYQGKTVSADVRHSHSILLVDFICRIICLQINDYMPDIHLERSDLNESKQASFFKSKHNY